MVKLTKNQMDNKVYKYVEYNDYENLELFLVERFIFACVRRCSI